MSLTQNVAQRLAANLEFDDEAQNAPAITNPNIVAVAQLLNDNPLLVTPTLRWVQQKIAEMANAQLNVLYTPAELEEMRAKIA